jgi:hypothetical protein
MFGSARLPKRSFGLTVVSHYCFNIVLWFGSFLVNRF